MNIPFNILNNVITQSYFGKSELELGERSKER